MDIPSSDQLKVLVVDDDELNQRMMRLILTREGHLVHIASDGVDALRAVREYDFDIILMDLQMPGMDGVEASRRIRESENGGENAYIVALTASYLPEKGHELFEAGMDNYIAKPFDVDHLRQMLDYGLDRRKSRLASVSAPLVDTASPDVPQGLDAIAGLKMVGNDQETYRELLADFVSRLPEINENIKNCFSKNDLSGLSRAAHNVKGVSSNLGALQLSEYAGELEKRAGEGYTDKALESIVRETIEISRKLIVDASDFLGMTESEINAL